MIAYVRQQVGGQLSERGGRRGAPRWGLVLDKRNLIVLVLGIVLIVLGFYYLARGSITLAPVLLVAGYCVAVPIGIIMGAPREGASSGARGDGANSSAG